MTLEPFETSNPSNPSSLPGTLETLERFLGDGIELPMLGTFRIETLSPGTFGLNTFGRACFTISGKLELCSHFLSGSCASLGVHKLDRSTIFTGHFEKQILSNNALGPQLMLQKLWLESDSKKNSAETLQKKWQE